MNKNIFLEKYFQIFYKIFFIVIFENTKIDFYNALKIANVHALCNMGAILRRIEVVRLS